jgi:hypothetical protein
MSYFDKHDLEFANLYFYAKSVDSLEEKENDSCEKKLYVRPFVFS